MFDPESVKSPRSGGVTNHQAHKRDSDDGLHLSLTGRRSMSIGICKFTDLVEFYKSDIESRKLDIFMNVIQTYLQRNHIIIDNVFDVIKIVMETAEELQIFHTGMERKKYVLTALHMLTVDKNLSESISKNLIRLNNTNMINDIIELLVGASKGYLGINKSKKGWLKCFK